MITFIKAVHTVIWVIMTLATFYIGYSVIRMTFDVLFTIAICLIMAEILVIITNAWTCPLTNIARRYSNETAANFDIYLPRTIARYNKEIFSVILVIILFIFIYNSIV